MGNNNNDNDDNNYYQNKEFIINEQLLPETILMMINIKGEKIKMSSYKKNANSSMSCTLRDEALKRYSNHLRKNNK